MAEVKPARDPMKIVTLVLLGLLTAVTIALIAYQVSFVGAVRATVDCLQANYAELNTSILAGRAAAEQDRASQRELLLTPATTPAERAEALQRYLRRLDEADQARSANPPPVRSCTTERETS